MEFKRVGDESKKLALRRSLMKLNPDLVLIRKTKRDSSDSAFIKELWSSKDIGWAFVQAISKSRGILSMWEESKISVNEVLKDGYSLSIRCQTSCKKVCWISIVYGPTNYRERKHLWLVLQSLADYCEDPWCIGGDFNITRRVQENFPIGRVTKGTRRFNNCIAASK